MLKSPHMHASEMDNILNAQYVVVLSESAAFQESSLIRQLHQTNVSFQQPQVGK